MMIEARATITKGVKIMSHYEVIVSNVGGEQYDIAAFVDNVLFPSDVLNILNCGPSKRRNGFVVIARH